MNAEIIAVGSELLTPTKVDTNSLWLTDQLNAAGIEVVQKAIAGDDRVRLAALIAGAVERSDLIILTGGLGPTEDDVTRDAVCQALGCEQHFHQFLCDAIAERFARMKRAMAENNKRQAFLIDGAEAIPNDRGTAPGQWIRLPSGKAIALLPGPPSELKGIWMAEIERRVRALAPPLAIATAHFRVAGMGESDLDQLIAPVYTPYTNPVTTILAAPGDVHIHLRARCPEAAEAQRLVDELGTKIRELLGDRIYSEDGADLETAVGRRLAALGATVSTAESMTGGLLGQRITSVPDSSTWFRGGLVTYTDEMKRTLLGIPADLLSRHSAVSQPVAIAMAQAARERTGATWALSITGYAGPSGDNVGLVFVGLAGPGFADARQLHLFGDRARIRNVAATLALDWLRKKLG
ncbi:MAG: competence/damage-inducible protein A [Bryobacterales bacterium]|nr:competence/damage-inducible protein A [Bryobacterales bacterium]